MQPICEDVPGHANAIVQHWDRFAQTLPRFADLPTPHRWDALPGTVSSLLRATLCEAGGDPATQRALIDAALQHGQDRRAAGIPPDMVFTEYALLHDAVWHHLQHVELEGRRLDAILRVDIGISLATRVSLTGYHRTELEANGAWKDIVDHLVDEAILFNRND